jgi:hypothetical protein
MRRSNAAFDINDPFEFNPPMMRTVSTEVKKRFYLISDPTGKKVLTF